MPSVHDEKGRGAVAELGQQVGPLVDTYVAALEARKLKDGIRIAMAISSVGERLYPAIDTTIGAIAFCLCPPCPILLHRGSHSCACWLDILPYVLRVPLCSIGNKFFQDHKPWEALKADRELCGSYLAACMGLVALLAALVEPYMPSITAKVDELVFKYLCIVSYVIR